MVRREFLTRLKRPARRIKRVASWLMGRDFRHPVQLQCPTTYLGQGYGAWAVCPCGLGEDSLVYSFGMGRDLKFDLGMIEQFGVRVFGFDPTPDSVQWLESQSLPDRFRWFPYGIADFDGTAQFRSPFPEKPRWATSHNYTMQQQPGQGTVRKLEVKRLGSIMEMLGHDHLDVLKMDIEGAEYAVLADVVDAGIAVRQILVEFHHRMKGIGVEKSKQAIRRLNEAGYKIFSVSDDPWWNYSFIAETAAQQWGLLK